MSATEDKDLIKLHEGFRFFSYLLLILSLYLNQRSYLESKGVLIPEFTPLVDKLLQMRFLSGIYPSKTVCLFFLMVTCIGTKAAKERELKVSKIVVQVLAGLIFYWGSLLLAEWSPLWYILSSFTGFVILNIGFDNVSKLINVNLMKDRFNIENESFLQQEKLMENAYSVNLRTTYLYRRELREGWINIVNPFRATMVI